MANQTIEDLAMTIAQNSVERNQIKAELEQVKKLYQTEQGNNKVLLAELETWRAYPEKMMEAHKNEDRQARKELIRLHQDGQQSAARPESPGSAGASSTEKVTVKVTKDKSGNANAEVVPARR
jgi:hypothetical protein